MLIGLFRIGGGEERRKNLSAHVPEVLREAERLADGEVGLHGHLISHARFGSEHVSSTARHNAIDPAHRVYERDRMSLGCPVERGEGLRTLSGLDDHKVDRFEHGGSGRELGSLEDSASGGYDLTRASVHRICVQTGIHKIEARTSQAFATEHSLHEVCKRGIEKERRGVGGGTS